MTQWLQVIHILGVVLWIGGVLSVGLVGAYASGERRVLAAARHASLRVATPGMVLAWVGGLTMFIMGIDVYKRAGWLHAKITLALVAAALTGILSGKLRKAAEGADIAGSTLRNLSVAVLVIGVLNIVLAFLGPVWMSSAS